MRWSPARCSRFTIVAGVAVGLASAGATADQVYRWTDEQGIVHFGDALPDNDIEVELIELTDVPTHYDPVQDPYSILNQAAQIHERWERLEQQREQRRAKRAAASERPVAEQVGWRTLEGIRYVGWPIAPGTGSSLSGRKQVRALSELDLLGPRPYSINSAGHRERVARSRALPLAGP